MEQFKLVELTIDNFVDLPEGTDLLRCQRCKRIITTTTFENNKCAHFTCYPCYNEVFAAYGGQGNCSECRDDSLWKFDKPYWTSSHLAKRKMEFLSVRCPIESCGRSFHLCDLETHNRTHIKPPPHVRNLIDDILFPFLKIMVILSIIAFIAGLPRALDYESKRLIAFDAPEEIVLSRLPYTYYWCTKALISLIFFGLLAVYLEPYTYYGSKRQHPMNIEDINRKIATCC